MLRAANLWIKKEAMDKFFQKIIQNNFSDLKGTTVDASVPVPQSLVNELLAETLKGNKNVSALQASIHPQNRVSLDVKTTLLPWTLNLQLHPF